MTLGSDGRFEYGSLSLYWTEPNRFPFIVRVDGRIAGFALVKKGSDFSGDLTVWDMADFFIVRGERRRLVGQSAASEVWRRFPGQWEVRVLPNNIPALGFWSKAISNYKGKGSGADLRHKTCGVSFICSSLTPLNLEGALTVWRCLLGEGGFSDMARRSLSER